VGPRASISGTSEPTKVPRGCASNRWLWSAAIGGGGAEVTEVRGGTGGPAKRTLDGRE